MYVLCMGKMGLLLLIMFLIICSEHQAQNTVKKLRPLSPDRPHQTESPYTVDPWHLQVETDLGNVTYNNQEPRSRALGLMYFNLKLGIQKRMDVEVISNAFTVTDFEDKNLAQEKSVMPDLTFRYKYNLLGNDSGSTCIALMPVIKTTNFFNEKWKAKTGGLLLNAEQEIGERFEIGYTGGISYFTMEPLFKEYELFSTVSFDYKVVGALHHFVEVSDRYNQFIKIKNNYSFDSGVTYTPTKNNQFDMGFYYFIPVKVFYFFIGTTLRI